MGMCSCVGALLVPTGCQALLMGSPQPPLLSSQICTWPPLTEIKESGVVPAFLEHQAL